MVLEDRVYQNIYCNLVLRNCFKFKFSKKKKRASGVVSVSCFGVRVFTLCLLIIL